MKTYPLNRYFKALLTIFAANISSFSAASACDVVIGKFRDTETTVGALNSIAETARLADFELFKKINNQAGWYETESGVFIAIAYLESSKSNRTTMQKLMAKSLLPRETRCEQSGDNHGKFHKFDFSAYDADGLRAGIYETSYRFGFPPDRSPRVTVVGRRFKGNPGTLYFLRSTVVSPTASLLDYEVGVNHPKLKIFRDRIGAISWFGDIKLAKKGVYAFEVQLNKGDAAACYSVFEIAGQRSRDLSVTSVNSTSTEMEISIEPGWYRLEIVQSCEYNYLWNRRFSPSFQGSGLNVNIFEPGALQSKPLHDFPLKTTKDLVGPQGKSFRLH